MKYFFCLGNNPILSQAEISAVFGFKENQIKFFSEDILIVDLEKEFNFTEIIKKMGGVIKIGVIEGSTKNLHFKNLSKQALKLIRHDEGKFKFGISFYGGGKFNVKPVGMEIKKALKEKNVSCRFVTSKEKVLSSVVVEQNKLIQKGIEIVFIKKENKIFVGKTLAVQDFKRLSRRDYGRPARDDHSGMLPPKLAQIMLNLASQGSIENKILLDPFCGSGTILNEAMLMGCKKMYGSDLSSKAIKDTKENLLWLYKNNNLKLSDYQLYNFSATSISEKIEQASIDIIVTEPFLGPQRGQIDFGKVKKELENLYAKAIREFFKMLKNNGRVVMIWPKFLNKIELNPKIDGFKIVSALDKTLDKQQTQKTKRNTIVYGRPGQKVWREIVILEKVS